MLVDVTLPQLGESVTEGTISKWLVREGDVVTKDQPLVEIATDKADSELPAPAAGRVARLFVSEGQVVAVKSVIAQIDEGVVAAAPPLVAAAAPSAAAPGRSVIGGALASPAARRAALEHDVNITDVRGTGDRGRVTADDVMRAAESGGASLLVSAPQHTAPPGTFTPPTETAAVPTTFAAPRASAPQAEGYVPPIPGVGYGAFKLPPYRPAEGDKVVPFTRRRRITADHMTYSKVASPHVVTVAEVDLHKASRLREAHKERYKSEGLSLTMLAFVVVATARALRETPQLNARVLDDAYVLFKDVNVGVAVDSPEGLVVPVVRRADELGVRGIVRAIDDLARRAKSGKITIDDLSGATFSVSNPGLKGNLFGGAIINQPNVGILRMGEIQKRVVVVEADGEDLMAIHPVMYVALS
jgi:2-oxoglutarate dehydrogenase E2 component (dihydrolipoamide succinyltransferase)